MVRTSTLKPAVPVAVIYRPAGLAGSSSLAKCQFHARGAGRGLPGHAGQSVVLAGAALPVLITGLDCEQVRQEMTRLSERINQLSGRLDKAATKDKTIGVVGTILFSPALMAMIMGLAGCASPARIDQLTADLLRVDQPMFGFNMTVSATAGYLIVEQATGNR